MRVRFELPCPGLGEKIREAVRNDPRSRDEICNRLGMSSANLSKIELEKAQTITWDTLKRFEEVLNVKLSVDLSDLSNFEEQKWVLNIDDEPGIHDVLKEIFDQVSPYAYKGVTAVKEGLDFLKEHHGQVTLLMIDIKMPQISGIDLAQTLSIKYPKIGIILVSGNADVEDLIKLYNDARFGNVLCCLSKPVDAYKLIGQIPDLLGRMHKPVSYELVAAS